MIKIKAVDGQNILDVCGLKTDQDDGRMATGGRSCCNAVSIAEANYHPELYPNAIYSNNVLIGFFMYQRTENQADTAIIRRFMIDSRFQRKGLEEKALEHILRGLKIQGVKKVILTIDDADESAQDLCLAVGSHFIGEIDKGGRYCKLEL